ncbi:MAG: electron transport complex subunit RsxE [Myxococcales bacterium]|nr:MAG: electron transport complex subunit RsxE [Myxococcales bacterium]
MSEKKAPPFTQLISDGVIFKNPIFVLALSLCPAVAVTSTAITAIGMGAAVLYVITMSNAFTSIFRKVIPHKVRLPCYITIIAFNVTLVQLVMSAYMPELYEALGVYLALVVVFAIILARAEVFASNHKVLPSMVDGFGMGLGFTLGLLLIGVIREFLGSGTFFGMPVIPEQHFTPVLMFILPPGGFVVIGLLIGLFNVLGDWRKRRAAEAKASPVPVSETVANEQTA